MSRATGLLLAVLVLLGLLASGCSDDHVVLTREDGATWDGHLAVGTQMTIGAEIIDPTFASYDVAPAMRLTVDDPSIVAVGQGAYGVTVLGLAPGRTTVHIFIDDATTSYEASLVVE